MSAQIIDGKAIAAAIRTETSAGAAALRARGIVPKLTAVIVGNDASAAAYAESQRKDAAGVGIEYERVALPAGATELDAIREIERLNHDASVSGIILQMPLPKSWDAFTIQQRIVPAKDVEGVGSGNLGLLFMGREALVPCTAAAAFACLKSTGVPIEGRDAVVVGRSVIVGKPLALLLLHAHATVTVCHTRTADLAAHTRGAEILLVAAGAAGLIGAEHVAPGTIVIDVGVHRVSVVAADGAHHKKTIGDVRYDEVAPLARAITPVPGGVGPVTVAMLLANTLRAAERAARTDDSRI